MIVNYKKFFESKQEDVFEDVKNIVFSSLDDLDMLQIDEPNARGFGGWGPCALVEHDYNDKYLLQNNQNGVYAVELTSMVKISIRFGVVYLGKNLELI